MLWSDFVPVLCVPTWSTTTFSGMARNVPVLAENEIRAQSVDSEKDGRAPGILEAGSADSRAALMASRTGAVARSTSEQSS